MNPRVFLARAGLALSLAAATNQVALAAPPAAPVVKEPGESPQYRALLEEAVGEYDARRYEEARALFRRAHDLSPNARTLRGIGMASFELREYVEALRSLEGALADKRRPLTVVQRQQVESLLERTRAFVGRFFVKLSPKETTLRIDGASTLLESDGSLLLSFGRHSVIAEAPGALPENREINVIGGERQELSFQLRPAAVTVGPTPGKSGAIPPEGGVIAPPPPAPEAPTSNAGWWFAGAGVAAAGAVVGALWWHDRTSTLDICNANPPDDPAVATSPGCHKSSTISSERHLAIGTTIGAVSVAAVMAIIGTVVWATNKPEPGTAIACGLGPGAVNCELKLSF